jgi:cobalt-zinc-cadmium efflux system protein
MSHDHHHHDHAGGRLGLAFALNVAFTLIELVGAWFTNSTAIAADAVHDLGDSLALAFAWGMQGASKRRADTSFTYGYRRLSLVGAVVNAVVLLVGGAIVLMESVPRLWDPPSPHVEGMLGLAVLGVAVNGFAALRLGKAGSLNERVVRLHLLEDVLGWVAVLIVSVVMLFVDLPILDPLLSVVITLWVAFKATRNLKNTLALFLQGAPDDVDVEALCAAAQEVEGVLGIRHVHVWSLDGDHHVLTGQLLVAQTDLDQAVAVRDAARERLEAEGVSHVTLELAVDAESGGGACGG